MDDGDEVVIVGMQYNSLVGGTSSTTSKSAGGNNSTTRPMLRKQASFSSLSDTPTPKQTATRLLGLALDAQHEDKVFSLPALVFYLSSHTHF